MLINNLKTIINRTNSINQSFSLNRINFYTNIADNKPKNIKKIEQVKETEDDLIGYGLNEKVLKFIKSDLNWNYFTTVQKKVLPLACQGKNVVASAWTGQGKTGAYMLPILNNLTNNTIDKNQTLNIKPKAIVMCPSSELANQVFKIFKQSEKSLNLKIGLMGGHNDEIKDLPKDLSILICTPGRLNFHLNLQQELKKVSSVKTLSQLHDLQIKETKEKVELDFTQLNQFVIDECDKLLGLGHLPDVLNIWSYLSTLKTSRLSPIQITIVSATLDPSVHGFIKKLAPHHQLIDLNRNMGVPKSVLQIRYDVFSKRKLALVLYLLRRKGKVTLKDKKTLIFCRTVQRCDRLMESLTTKGFKSYSLHSSLTPTQRKNRLDSFLTGDCNILICTDIAARGLDLDNLELVLNYDLPHVPLDYIHRVGRCGRLCKKGTSISLVSKDSEVITRSNGITATRDEQLLIKEIDKILSNSKLDKNCSQIEVRKVPGPFLDVDDYNEVKSVIKDQRFKGLINMNNSDNDNDIKNKLDEDNINYSNLMSKFDRNQAKSKGLKISKKDLRTRLYANPNPNHKNIKKN